MYSPELCLINPLYRPCFRVVEVIEMSLQDIAWKEMRVSFWEKYHQVISIDARKEVDWYGI
jgi:hypothetical protein